MYMWYIDPTYMCTCIHTQTLLQTPDYTVTVGFENGSSVTYTVDAATLFVFIDEPEGSFSVMVAAINGAGRGQVGTPSTERKLDM